MSNLDCLSIKIAQAILDGFGRHFSIFQENSTKAKQHFERQQWQSIQTLVKQRLYFYDERVKEKCESLQKTFNLSQFDECLWRKIKHSYIHLLYNHCQPDLAETFFNSLFCRLFHRRHYNNDFIFVRPSVSDSYVDLNKPVVDGYHFNNAKGLKKVLKKILLNPQFNCNYQDLDRDIKRLSEQFYQNLEFDSNQPLAIEVLKSVFFRNQAAYIIGRIASDSNHQTFCIALLNKADGIIIDALILDSTVLATIFSFSYSYFLLATDSPSAVVRFLKTLMHSKTKADLYSAIGLHKQGKTIFYRMFLYHNATNQDLLQIAPGVSGMVMSVFTFPIYPYVFKVIKDSFKPPKNTTKEAVRKQYQRVKAHNRIGRLADTWEFSNVAFPIDKVSNDLMSELKKEAASNLELDGNLLIIKHLYIEKKMIPLDIYLRQNKNQKAIKHIINDYGLAIKELINANIFPGDLLLKNFGVTNNKRVVFYDYDEIVAMDKVNFRYIPKALTLEQEMASQPWYHVADNDVFPEEFCQFLFTKPNIKKYFQTYHSDLLSPEYWQEVQQKIKNGTALSVLPYSDKYRMDKIYQS